MSDRAISEEAMLTSLRDIRLPPDAAGGIWADLAITVGLAGLAALIVAGLLQLLSLRRTKHAPAPRPNDLAGLHDLPDADRRVALLHLLRRHAPDRYQEIRGQLYQPRCDIDIADLEAEVARHV